MICITKKNNYYPEYIVNALFRIVNLSTDGKHRLLSRGTEFINVLYNHYNDFPITDQAYQIIWLWINKMADIKNEDWLRMYWGTANQYFTFKLKYTDDYESRSRFIEFHTMVGVLLLHKECYVALKHALFFTNSMPANYPLIQNTFKHIFLQYQTLSKRNENMELMHYQMSKVFEGAGDESKIESLLLKYCALLMVRLMSVNDYNITYSDPLALPPVGNTIEENDRIITIIKVMKNYIMNISRTVIESLSLNKEEGQRNAIKLLNEYEEICNDKIINIKNSKHIDTDKKKSIKKRLIIEAYKMKYKIPTFNNKCSKIKKLYVSQGVQLDKSSILSGYDYISSNLEETLIASLLYQLHYNYRMLFLKNSPLFSITIPYIDMGKALASLDLDNSYAIIAMGVNNHFFNETEGFCCYHINEYSYGESEVYQISASESSLIIMKASELPFFDLCDNYENLDRDMQLLDNDTKLYSNIDDLSKETRFLKVAQCYNFHIPHNLRYIRIKMSYNLTSDPILLNKVQPIKKYFHS